MIVNFLLLKLKLVERVWVLSFAREYSYLALPRSNTEWLNLRSNILGTWYLTLISLIYYIYMSRPATNKSLPPQDQSIRINDVRDNKSVDKSEIMKSRVSQYNFMNNKVALPKRLTLTIGPKTTVMHKKTSCTNLQSIKYIYPRPLDRQKVIEQNMKLKS